MQVFEHFYLHICKICCTFAAVMVFNPLNSTKMKKLFSILAVACALVFTSCNTKIDSPLVGWWSAPATIVDVNPDGTQTERAGRNELNFIDNGQFQQNMYYAGDSFSGYYAMGTWSVKDNKVTIRKTSSGKIDNKNFVADSSFKPFEEEYTWRIEGHYLYLTTSEGIEYTFRDGEP